MTTNFVDTLFRGTSDLIEIREISEHGEAKQRFLKAEDFNKYVIPQNKNVYIGIYGRSQAKGTKEACNTTRALWADYDGLTAQEVKQNIQVAGVPVPSMLISSGNGIHSYWILEEEAGAEAEEVIKALAQNTGADTRATDKARIMRLPGSYNLKQEPKPCQVIETNDNRYKLKDIANILGVEALKMDSKASLIDIGYIDRPCIKHLLQGATKGERNFALGRITKYLQHKGYTREKSEGIIIQWNKLCSPPKARAEVLADFGSYWEADYKLLGCVIEDEAKQGILSHYCDRMECDISNTIGSLVLDNTVSYNNRVFNNIADLKGSELLVYGLLLRHKEGLTMDILLEKLTNRITGKPCISERSLKGQDGVLNALKGYGLITITKGIRKAGKGDLYKARPQGTYGLGYTIISNGAINGVIDGRITTAQFKIYALLLKYNYHKGEVYPSLVTLAKELRTTFQNVSNQIIELEKADYVKRNYIYPKGTQKLLIKLLV